MRLTIDNDPYDLIAGQRITLDYDAVQLREIEQAREGLSAILTLPATQHNEHKFGAARDIHAAECFNATLHQGRITERGATLLSGVVRMLGSTAEGYTVEIRSGGAQWARNAARNSLDRLPVSFAMGLTPTEICNTWRGDSAVRFLPIHRDEYPPHNSYIDLLPAERLLTVDDYHPFLHIATLVESLFTEAGYRIESRFLNSEFFRSLHMSGAFASRNTAAAQNRMGFLARRITPVTAKADYMGRVYANPKALYNTVGNIVETATPRAADGEREAITDVFNNGESFRLDDGKITYIPLSEVSAGFEYYIRYTTDHRILSRTRLKGFDSVYLGPGANMPFQLANRYADRRAELMTNHSYLAIVFDHTDGAQYRLRYTLNGTPATLWREFASRTVVVTTPTSGGVAAPTLQLRSGSSWTDYIGDWALYDGHIAPTGQTTVELRVSTPSEILSPAAPKLFNTIFFSGAEEGMNLTLHQACSLRARFTSQPGYGQMVTFADVAHHPIRQSELLEALCHLFNLRIYTEQEAKTVYIEPADDFFEAGVEADWRAKTDFSHPVEFEDLALGIHERRTWAYTAGDGAVARQDAASTTPMGEWSVKTDSFAALEGERVLRNQLFQPTLNSAGHYTNAPSALMPQVGDRDAADNDGANFSPRIVRYCGLHPLLGDQRWGYPWGQSEYPLAAFHFAGDDTLAPFTLCFEPRDGAAGLHRYYDHQVAQESTRQRITLHLRIEPHEFEALFTPGTGAPDIRSVFWLNTGTESVRTTLDSIDGYDPSKGSVRCSFLRTSTD